MGSPPITGTWTLSSGTARGAKSGHALPTSWVGSSKSLGFLLGTAALPGPSPGGRGDSAENGFGFGDAPTSVVVQDDGRQYLKLRAPALDALDEHQLRIGGSPGVQATHFAGLEAVGSERAEQVAQPRRRVDHLESTARLEQLLRT